MFTNANYIVMRNCGLGGCIVFAFLKILTSVGGPMTIASTNNDAKATVQKMNQTLSENPSNYDAYTKRGFARFILLQLKDAVADYDMALSIYPSSDLYNKRADAYEMLGEHDKSLADRAAAKNFD